jgi:hypothetical protein
MATRSGKCCPAMRDNPLLDRIDGLASYFTKRSYWIFRG